MSVFAPYGKIPGAWPWGITQSRGPGSQYEQPYDPQYNANGEAGYYYDTQLGAIRRLSLFQQWKLKRYYKNLRKQRMDAEASSPFLGALPTDFELAKTQNYTPVTSGWIWTTKGYLTPPWLPPNGYAQGGYAMPVQPNDGGGRKVNPMDLRFYTPDYVSDSRWNTSPLAGLRDGQPATPATVENVVAEMNRHNDRVFALTLVSTTAVAVSAIITVFRTLRLIKSGG